MCGRYTLSNPDPKRLKLRFGIDDPFEFDERPRFNIAPTDSVLAVRRHEQDPGRELGRLRWGLMPGRWAEKPGRPLINARAETVATQPAYRESFQRRRCLIPADGFYEWKKLPTGKQPMWMSLPEAELFAFAGIWASLERSDGETVHSCSIITCEPNEVMREIHDRMPVILDPEGSSRRGSIQTPIRTCCSSCCARPRTTCSRSARSATPSATSARTGRSCSSRR